MQRRSFLRLAASAGAVGALAGCTQNPDRNNSSDGDSGAGRDPSTTKTTPGTANDQVTTETTDGADEGTPATPTIPSGRDGTRDGVDYTIAVTSAECASGARTNTVDDIDFDEDASEIVVTGTIDASNPCKVADVSAIEHDTDDGSVAVTITTVDREESTQMCAECLGAIEYEATLTFGDNFPNEASVVHDGRSGRHEMASAAYGSSSASAPTTTDSA